MENISQTMITFLAFILFALIGTFFIFETPEVRENRMSFNTESKAMIANPSTYQTITLHPLKISTLTRTLFPKQQIIFQEYPNLKFEAPIFAKTSLQTPFTLTYINLRNLSCVLSITSLDVSVSLSTLPRDKTYPTCPLLPIKEIIL